MQSIWSIKSDFSDYSPLQNDIKTSVLIVGGGIAGILCATELNSRGVDCVIAEADRICSKVTKNTTAKITSQHGFIYSKLVKNFGIETAQKYLTAHENAIAQYQKMCKDIDCDFEIKDNIVYCVDNIKKAEKEMSALSSMGYSAEFRQKIPAPIDIAGAVAFKNQAQFNPLKFLSYISKGLTIYENTKVIEIRDNKAITDKGTIKADYFVIATHFPFMNKYGAYFMKLYQERSYVIAVDRNENLEGMYVDEDKKGMSFRNYENMTLIGGGDHRTGKQGGNYNELRNFIKLYYPENREVCHWATQDCMSLDGIPYIGQYSPQTPNVFVITGFNKWGMASSMAASGIISDKICGRENDCADIFSPVRSILTPQLMLNMGESLIGLITPSKKRCPHLGCSLKWNSAEHTWDCPCHGSRFSENGKLLDNPATDDIEI